jgi:hypothetical protein
MLQILEGSIVAGKSGKLLKVISVDDDGLVLKSDTGVVRAKRSAIVRVISPPPANSEPPPEATIPLAIGDTVYYCGDRYWQQYRDVPLVLVLLREGEWTAEKPDGYYTTNLSARELSRSPVDRPKLKATRSPQKGQWLKEWELEQKRKY